MNRLRNILSSFSRLTRFTQIWLLLFLGPAVIAPIFTLSGPLGIWPAVLALLGTSSAPFLLWREQGFSGSLAFGHLIFWPFFVGMVVWHFYTDAFRLGYNEIIYLAVSGIFVISIVFDIREAIAWFGGKRDAA